MSSYRQLPAAFRKLHPKLKTPWLSLVVFAGHRPDALPALRAGRLPRPDVRVRRDALVHDRACRRDRRSACGDRDEELEWRARPNLTHPRHQLAALRDRRRDRHGRRVARRRRPGRADAVRRPRLADRRLRLLRPLPAPAAAAADAARQRAPVPLGPALALEYRSILVPIVSGDAVARGGRGRGAPRDRARRPDRAAARDRRPARAAARRRPDRAARGSRRAARRGARDRRRPTACAPSSASCARATPAARSSRRPTGAAPRSSCSARRAGATGTSSGIRSTTSSSTRRAA